MRQSSTKESGRSLTEMLGVLAIVGVLSIASIFGFQYAMNKYRANNTIAELTQRALIVSIQMIQKAPVLQMDELGNTTYLGYGVVAKRVPDNTALFNLEVTGIQVDTCEQILKSDWEYPIMIKANNITYAGNASICEPDDQKDATMIFQFHQDLDETAKPEGYCKSNDDCNGCDVCQENMCVSQCTGTDRCARDYDVGVELCCPKDRRVGDYCCSDIVNGMCCNSNSYCCPAYKPLKGKDGNCYTCDTADQVDVTGVLSHCSVCPNRELVSNMCRLKCPSDTPLRDKSGACHACNEVASVFVRDVIGNCKVCSNRVLNGDYDFYCSLPCGQGLFKGKPLTDRNGACHACDENAVIRISAPKYEDCNICPNRELSWSYCILPCPKETPLKGTDNKCYACDDPNPVNSDGMLCPEICPNRVYNGYYDRKCSLPCGEGVYADKPLTDGNGFCHACDEPEMINVSNVNPGCEVCPNRQLEGMWCTLSCPKDKPLRGDDNQCYACDEKNPVGANGLPCSEICSNRVSNGFYDRICSLPCGQGLLKDKPLTDNKGFCHACDEPEMVNVSNVLHNGCEVCPNRDIAGSMCVLPCPLAAPLKGKDNKCYACDNPNPVNMDGTSDDCTKACPNRVLNGWHDRMCSFALCGQGIFKDKPLTDAQGICYSCDEKQEVNITNVTHQGCEMCTNRKILDEFKCVLT